MSTLQLKVSAVRSEILAGEGLRLTVTIHNSGATPVPVPDPRITFDFEILLRVVDKPELGYTLSKRMVQTGRYPNETPLGRIVRTAPLASGATNTYRGDLGDLTLDPLRVGEYKLSAGLEWGDIYIESPAIPLSIRAPRVRALSAVFTGAGLHEVIAHLELGGGKAIYQRSAETNSPMWGPRFRRAEGAEAGFGVQTATTVPLNSEGGPLWYGWRTGDTVSAGVAQERTVFSTVGPHPVGLKNADLHPVGWQPDQEHAFFLALGHDASGQTAVAVIKAEAVGKIDSRMIPLGGDVAPAHWAARFDAATAKMLLIGVSETAGASTVWSRTISIGSGTAEPMKTEPLAELDGRVEMLAMEPVGQDDTGTVDILMRKESGKEWELVRIPLAGGPPLNHWRVTAPDNEAALLPSGWAIGTGHSNDPAVLAMVGDKVYLYAMRTSTWRVLAEGATEPNLLRILDNGTGTRFAVWVNPKEGVNYQPIGQTR